jgi:hypothetical protein
MAISKKQADVLRKITVAEQLAGRLGTGQVAIFPWDQHLEPTYRVLLDVLAMGGEPGGKQSSRCAGPWWIRRARWRQSSGGCAGFGAWVNAQQRNIRRLSEEISGAIMEAVRP